MTHMPSASVGAQRPQAPKGPSGGTKARRVVLYARSVGGVRPPRGAAKLRPTSAEQIEKMETWAHDRTYIVDSIIDDDPPAVRTSLRRAQSGAEGTFRRPPPLRPAHVLPGLASLERRIETQQWTGSRASQNPMDIVVVWRLDRIAYDHKDFLDKLIRWAAAGVCFVSLEDGIDTTLPRCAGFAAFAERLKALDKDAGDERRRAGVHARDEAKRAAGVKLRTGNTLKAPERAAQRAARAEALPPRPRRHPLTPTEAYAAWQAHGSVNRAAKAVKISRAMFMVRLRAFQVAGGDSEAAAQS